MGFDPRIVQPVDYSLYWIRYPHLSTTQHISEFSQDYTIKGCSSTRRRIKKLIYSCKKIKRSDKFWGLFSAKSVVHIKTKMYRTAVLQTMLYGCETWSLTQGKLQNCQQGAEDSIWLDDNGYNTIWKKLHYEDLPNLYLSSNIIRIIKSSWFRKAQDTMNTCCTENRNVYTFWSENLKLRSNLQDLDVNGRQMLPWI
jgi:hypothetical protein